MLAVMDDLLRIETRVCKLRGASIEFDQLIFRDDRQLVAS
ncbi:MAG: hypothetical protein JO288_04525 [Hyphomicrobiales bacterium]|nr:hypothetical protein [Hyphomicrobiales bacterium]